jgi:hypothetical protein
VALNRFVLTASVTLTPEVAATVVAGEPGTGGPSGFGGAPTAATPTSGKFGWLPVSFQRGQVIFADSVAGTDTGAKLLCQAIGAGNLRAFTQGTDDAGHAGISN